MCAFRPNASMMTRTAGERSAVFGRARQPGSDPPSAGTSIVCVSSSIGSVLRGNPKFDCAGSPYRRLAAGFNTPSRPPNERARRPNITRFPWVASTSSSPLTARCTRRTLKRLFGEKGVRREKSNYIIQSVSHSLDVLEQFCGEADELGVTELSKRLKLHKNNVFRLLATLESRGYIEQNRATENYRLGIRCLQLGQSYLQHMGLLHQARPIMSDLVRQVRETTYVAVLRRNSVVPVDVVEADRPVRIVSPLGEALPLHCTAAGKAILAFEPEDALRTLLPDGLHKFTEKTLTERPGLMQQLKTIANAGYAIDSGEHLEDARGI